MKTASLNASLVPAAVGGMFAMASAMGFGRFSFTPILPGMISGVPLSSSDAGLIAAGNFAGYLIGALVSAQNWAAGRERRVTILALLATALLQLAMAATSSVLLFVVIRFLAGLASAFVMVFSSSIVLGIATARGSEHVSSTHFGGVGIGIAASSLVVAALGLLFGADADGWRYDWLAGGALSLVAVSVVGALLPEPGTPQGINPGIEPPLRWTVPVTLMTISYALFGFGYVITATFVVAMARMGDAGALIEFLTWFLAGLTAAASIFAWRPIMARIGLAGTYIVALVAEAVGVAATALLPVPAAPLVGGLLLGATFVIITAYGLRIARILSPQSPRRAISIMTVAFGIGQIIGPLVAGAMAERTGGFAVPSLIAALVLALAATIFLPVRQRIS